MKQLLFMLYFLPTFCMAQKEVIVKDKSNTEIFTEKSGNLLKKEFHSIGTFKKAKFEVYKVTDMVNNKTVIALRIEFEVYKSYGNETKIAILDKDELDGVIKSFQIIKDKVIPTLPEDYTEVTFTSRGGFEAGAFIEKKEWRCYIRLDKYSTDGEIFFDTKDLDDLIKIFEDGNSKM